MSRVESRANELKERVIKLETEKEVDQLRIAAKSNRIDDKFEEIIAKHVEEIEDLKDRLGKTEVSSYWVSLTSEDRFTRLQVVQCQ